MAVHALTEVGIAPGRAREALRAAVRLGRQLSRQPGFRGMQVFRSETDPDSLMVLTEWVAWEAATATEEAAPVAALLKRARAVCTRWDSRPLDPLFHVQLPRRHAPAGMAQALHVGTMTAAEGAAKQKEFGLKAMTLPGTVGVLGGRCARDPSFYFCAVAFDSDAALIDFAGSATRGEWARMGVSTWWRKDIRLEVRRDDAAERPPEAKEQTEEVGNLSVRVESSTDGAAMTLRLCGHMDEAAAERLARVRDAVVARGCRELTMDVSDLSSVTRDGLQMLLETARRVKESGGQFTLVDSQGRFNRILRVFHLNRVLALGRDETPRRRAANLPMESPWKM